MGGILFNCDNCGKEHIDRRSHYNRKVNHFCCLLCYSEFRKTKLPFDRQNAYKGVRKNADSKQVYHRNYVAKHKDNISHLKARSNAKSRGATGSHTLKQWVDIKLKFGNKCAICKCERKLTKDHIIPISKGGTDYIENIQPLCRNCNSKKHNKIIYENPDLLK